MSSFSYTDSYLQYLNNAASSIDDKALEQINLALKDTDWDSPSSSYEWNNLAVLSLVEAEQCDDLEMRSVYLETAFEALNNGIEIDNHPLCIAHLALIHSLVGETQEAINIGFSAFVNLLQLAYSNTAILPGLIYLPINQKFLDKEHNSFKLIFQAKNIYQQSLCLLSEVLCRSQLVFYNTGGLRILNLNAHLLPQSAHTNLKLGISNFMCNQWEGILHLHKARELEPNYVNAIQALYLVYRDIGQLGTANYWLKIAQEFAQQHPDLQQWEWAKLALDSKFTYILFENSLTMAVEPSFRSIVTGVLVAEGDWFEKEMEFWRSWLKPGMTVIDVGANVGVYTFSAALQVGAQGKVIAIEPFSGCVNCLEETSKINQLSQVEVCRGAASEKAGTVKLSLHAASELNEIVDAGTSDNMQPGTFEEVSCFTLDSLIAKENLSQVDFLKIDAEGHELQVLEGCEQILSDFKPVIMYENIAASQGSNLPVAKFLINKGYELFKYKPYVQSLIPLTTLEEVHGNLNIIALCKSDN
jgi:FkbM family methyltransferase